MKSNPVKSSKKQILLIEDDELTRESVLFKLNKSGFKTDFAEDGEIGLEKLRQNNNFDLILLDLRMPKGDGFWFLEKRKDDPAINKIPVIIFTNLSQREFIDRTLKLGAVGYLVKAHHSLDDIIEEVNHCMKGEKCQVDY